MNLINIIVSVAVSFLLIIPIAKSFFQENADWLPIVSIYIMLNILILGLMNYFSKLKQNNSWADVAFVIILSIVLIVPITKIDTKEIDTTENRKLAISPTLFEDNVLNNNYGKEFEAWLNDRFRYRQKLINVHDKTEKFFRGRIENERAFVGKENWIFYRGENSVELYQNKIIFTDTEMEKFKIVLEDRKQWLNAKGIEFFVIIPPDKSSVYGEFYKNGIMKVGTEDRVQLLKKYLQANNAEVEINYLLDLLNSHKNDGLLYYKTDTHWGEYGAYLGYLSLMKDIQIKFPDVHVLSRDRMAMEKGTHPSGDLTTMLRINDPELYNDMYFLPVPKDGYNFSYIKNNGVEGIITQNSLRKLKVLVFRDSFGSALVPYLSETFGHVEYIWNHNFNDFQEKIIQESPDIVIHETVSRQVHLLLNDTPELKEEIKNVI